MSPLNLMCNTEMLKVTLTCLHKALATPDLTATTIKEVSMLKVQVLTIKISKTGGSLLPWLQFNSVEEVTLKHYRILLRQHSYMRVAIPKLMLPGSIMRITIKR